MKCKSTSKRLLAFLDKDLPVKKRNAVQQHLDGCRSCRVLFDKLAELWKPTLEFDTHQPSLCLWNRIHSRIQEYDQRGNSLFNFPDKIARYAVKAAGAVLVLAGIMTGIYLGSFPDTQEMPIKSNRSNGLLGEEAPEGDCLSSFDDIPPQSLGGIYLTLLSGREGGTLK